MRKHFPQGDHFALFIKAEKDTALSKLAEVVKEKFSYHLYYTAYGDDLQSDGFYKAFFNENYKLQHDADFEDIEVALKPNKALLGLNGTVLSLNADDKESGYWVISAAESLSIQDLFKGIDVIREKHGLDGVSLKIIQQ